MVRCCVGLTGPWREPTRLRADDGTDHRMAWVTGYEVGRRSSPRSGRSMVGAHAAAQRSSPRWHRDRPVRAAREVALLEVATAVTRRAGDGYAIDGSCSTARHRRCVPRAGRRPVGASSRVDPVTGRRARRVVRDAHRRRGGRRVARRGHPAAACAGVRDARRPAVAGARLLRADRPPCSRCARILDVAVRMRPVRRAIGRPRPTLGQHTRRSGARRARCDDDELERLREAHVIARRRISMIFEESITYPPGVLDGEPDGCSPHAEQIETRWSTATSPSSGVRAVRAAARQLPHRLLRHVRIDIGTWMQNVVLAPMRTTDRSSFVRRPTFLCSSGRCFSCRGRRTARPSRSTGAASSCACRSHNWVSRFSRVVRSPTTRRWAHRICVFAVGISNAWARPASTRSCPPSCQGRLPAPSRSRPYR